MTRDQVSEHYHRFLARHAKAGGLHYHTPPTRNDHDQERGMAGKPEVSRHLPGAGKMPGTRPIGSAQELGLDLM